MGFQDSYRQFLKWLKRERGRHLLVLALFGLVRFLAVAGLGWLGAILLGALPLPARPLLFAAAAVTAGALLACLAWPLLRAPGLRGFARLVDHAFPDLKDRTINSLELGSKLDSAGGPEGAADAPYEPAFVAALVDDTRRRTGSLDVSGALRPRRLGAWGGALAGVAALTALLLALPGPFSASAKRLLHPSQPVLPFGLHVTPGDVTIHPGEDVNLAVELRGATGRPKLRVRGDYEAWRDADLAAAGAARAAGPGWSAYAARLGALQRTTSYQVVAGSHRSPVYTVKIREPLAVLSFHKHLDFPGYSGLPAQDATSATGELDGLKGTRAALTIETSGEVTGAWLRRGEGAGTALERVDAHHFRAAFSLVESGEYRVKLQEEGGATAEAGPYAISVVPDQDPTITLVSPSTSGFFPPDMHLPIAAEVADDYGISRVELVVQGASGPPQRIPIPVPAGFKQGQAALDWDASPLNPGPGESVTLWVEARDNDAVSGPKLARSETRTFRVPSVAEMFRAAEQANEQGMKDVARLAQEQQELKSKLEEATRNMQQNGSSMSWEKKKELESTVARQKDVLDKIQKTADQINESLDKTQEQNLVRDEVLKKMEELREIMKQLDSETLREMLKKAEEALKKADPDEVKRALENMKLSEQDLLAAMERTLQALKQLQKAEKLNAAAKLAEELAKQQKDLADQVEKKAQQGQDSQQQQQQKDLAQKQKDLAQQANKLSQDVDQLKKDLAQTAPQTTPKLDEAQKALDEQARPEMAKQEQEMSEQSQDPQSQDGKPGHSKSNSKPSPGSSAGKKHARSAAEQMEQVSQSLRQAQKKLQEDTNEEMAKRIRSAAHDLVGISGRQQELGESAEPGSEQARHQQSLLDGTQQVIEQLHQAEQQYGPLPGAIMRGLGQAASRMETSRDLLEKGNAFGGRALGKEAGSAINGTVLGMLESAQSMCSKGGPGGGIPKPGAQQRMGGLSQQQMEINRSTEEMLKQGQGQRRLQPGEGNRPGESGSERASRLAAEQDAVRQGLEDMAREQAKKRELLGNLDNIADQMKKVAGDMANNRVSQETVDMEKKILSRMLDAQRSVNRRDRDPERWSRPGEAMARQAPGEIPAALLQKRQRTGTDLLHERRDPVPATYLPAVEQYFRNLPPGK